MNKIRDAGNFSVFLILMTALLPAVAQVTSSAADEQAHAQAINNAIGRAMAVRSAVADYQRRHNDFPSSNTEAGVAPAANYANADVKRIEVGSAGVIQVTLTTTSGVDDGVIVFKPAKSQKTTENDVDWTCASASYSAISDITGGVCEYSKVP